MLHVELDVHGHGLGRDGREVRPAARAPTPAPTPACASPAAALLGHGEDPPSRVAKLRLGLTTDAEEEACAGRGQFIDDADLAELPESRSRWFGCWPRVTADVQFPRRQRYECSWSFLSASQCKDTGGRRGLQARRLRVDAQETLPPTTLTSHAGSSLAASHTNAKPIPSQILPSLLACLLVSLSPPPCKQTHPTRAMREAPSHTRTTHTRNKEYTGGASSRSLRLTLGAG